MSAEEFSKTRIGKTYLEPDPQEMFRREQEMSRLREKYRGDKSDSITFTTPSPAPVTPPPLPRASVIVAHQPVKERPQPVDYGLTYYDLHFEILGSPFGDSKPRDALKYKTQDQWLSFLASWMFLIAVWFPLYCLFFAALVAAAKPINDGMLVAAFFLGMIVPGFMPGMLVLFPVCLAVQGVANNCMSAYKRRHPSAGYREYQRALRLHEEYVDAEIAAANKARQAAREAARDAELRKRSYWTFLDGYGFERATAEVLNKHQFNAWVTPGSGDGGVDIRVTRNGLKGIVQCKAHMACVGPHVVRDLYGVIHHTRADFGIIVSLGGFTKGASDFRRDKPILFVDLDDLIAMQEGRDVLAAAFSESPTTAS